LSLKFKEERQSSGIYVDPNRDFPYNIQDGKCLMSSTARAISHLFKKYMVQAAISFHGGGQSIS